MKLSALLMVVFSLNISATGFGQFTFRAEGKTVREVFDVIEQQSNYRFFYNDEFVTSSKTVDLEIKNQSISQVLDKILAPTDYTYKIFENNLIVISLKDNIREQTDLQQNIVKGTITDEKGMPVPGATVAVKGTTIGTTTDMNGNYRLENVTPNAVLVVSFIGYKNQEIVIGDKAQINITLQQEVTVLEEVVVVGYGTQRREAVTGSVASMPGETLGDVPSSNITQAMEGRVAGVIMSQTSSQPGATMQIRIRGTRSLNASNDPLVVVDGIPFAGSIGDIDPNYIKSIDILKDASATAIYGSRGANGVVLITTNKGQTGQKAQVTFNSYGGMKKVFAPYPMMDGPEFIALRTAAGKYTNGVDESNDVNTNWQNLFYRTGMVTHDDLGISGGTATGNYSFGVGYDRDEAVVPLQDYTRFSLRASIDQGIGKYFRFGFTSTNNYSINNGLNESLYGLLSSTPIANPYNADGTLKRTVKMPLDENWVYTRKTMAGLGDQYADVDKAYGSYNSLYGEVKIPGIEGLKYRANMFAEFRMTNHGDYTGMGIFSSTPSTPSVANIGNSLTTDWTIENLLTYDRTFAGKHEVNAVAMYSAEQTMYFSSYVSAQGIPNDAFQFYNIGQASGQITISPNNQNYYESGLMSWMGRVMYSYDNRYMLTATFRADASSRLAPGHQWHSYPAVSAGWNIKNESFMKDINVISSLKLRVGFGQTSNQSIAPYSTLGRLTTVPYNFGPTTYSTGYSVSQLPNYNLGWEFSKTWNFGLDFALLNNRLSGTVEYYITHTNDLLLSVNLPSTSGVSSYMANVGETQNKGLELSLNGVILKNLDGFTWEAGLNVYGNRNDLVKLASGQTRDEANWWFVGHPIDVIFDYQKIGLWQTQDQFLTTYEPGGNVGMIKVKYTGTYNADGSPTRAIGAADRQIMSVQPDFMGGFNTRLSYKGFDLSAIGTFQRGGLLISTLYSASGYLNLMTGRRENVKVDYWTPTNTGANYPAPNGEISGDNPKYGSTLGYFDASYLKIRTLSLGYDFDHINWIKTAGISRLRLYVTVENPFVMFSPYYKESGMDPETNSYGNQNQAAPGYNSRLLVIGTNTPETRNYLIGISLTF